MRRITFSADPKVIERARRLARLNNTTLDEAFRTWLAGYAKPLETGEEIENFLDRFKHFRAGRMPTRDELNQR